jgi:IS5 family transposase
VAVGAANTHDSLALIPLVQAIPAIRSRRGPRRRRPARLHADKGYDYPHLRTWLRRRRITPRIARRGIKSSTRLGHQGRWLVGREGMPP